MEDTESLYFQKKSYFLLSQFPVQKAQSKRSKYRLLTRQRVIRKEDSSVVLI